MKPIMTEGLTRRAVVRASLMGNIGFAAALAGCKTGNNSRMTSSQASSSSGGDAEVSGSPESSGEHTEVSRNPQKKILLVYFSRAGENYWNGGRRDLKVGNTELLGDLLAKHIECDTYRIEPADPYPASYDETVARNVEEEQTNARPAITNPLPEVSRYDTVLLGSPVWNVRAPMIMRTFIDGVDLSGKTVLPFVTYAVSGMGSVEDDYRRLLPDSKIRAGLAVRGETVADAASQVDDWLRASQLQPGATAAG